MVRIVGLGPRATKILDGGCLLHSEWNRRLGICSLIATGGVTVLSTVFGFLLTNLFSVSQSSSPPLTSVLIACALFLIVGEQYRVISHRIPLNGLMYNLAFTSHSELLAYVIGWEQIFDGVAFLSILVKVLTNIMKMLFNHRLEKAVLSESISQDRPVAAYLDYIIIVCSFLMMLCSLRVLSTVSIVFIVATLFTITSTTVVALLHNLVHLQVHYIGFPYNYQEVMDGVDALIIGILTIECISYISEEADHPHTTIPQIFPFLSRAISIVLFMSMIAFFPFSYRRPYTIFTLLPSTFDTIGIFSARYLLNVGLVCGLSAAICVAYLGPSRIISQFALDGIIPNNVGQLYGKGGSPRFAVFIVALMVCAFTLLPQPWLCSALSCSIMLRLFAQSVLIYNVVLSSSKEPVEDDASPHSPYNTLDASRCSSGSDRNQSVVDSTYSELTSDDEDDIIVERVWKVTTTCCEETSLLHPNPTSYDALTQNKLHNCLHSPCQQNPGSSGWQKYHVYDAEDQYEMPKTILESSERAFGIDKTQENARRALALELLSSILIALSSTIIRETPEYLPIMPVITLIVGCVSFTSILVWICRIKPSKQNERWAPLLSVLMMFSMIQLLFHIRILLLLPIITWNLIGIIIYFIFWRQRK